MLPILSTGVDIPNDVHQALEEERLVFFCGAGISVYTGLADLASDLSECLQKTRSRQCGREADDEDNAASWIVKSASPPPPRS